MSAAITDAVQAKIDQLEAEAEQRRQEKMLQKWLVVFRFGEEVLDKETNQPKIQYGFSWTFLKRLKEAPQRCADKISDKKKITSIWACDWRNDEPDCEPFLFWGNEESVSDRVARSLLFQYRKQALEEIKELKRAPKVGPKAAIGKKKDKPHIRYSPPPAVATPASEVPTYYGPYSLIEAPKAK